MRRKFLSLIILHMLFFSIAICYDIPIDNYQIQKTWHEKALSVNPTKAQRLDYMRALIKSSRYGEKGLNNIFNNFKGPRYIDPTIKGVEQTARYITLANKSSSKGYARELIYATEIYNNKKFKLLELNKIIDGTDVDISAIHRKTRIPIEVEVKDVTPKSQKSDLKRLKRQIDIKSKRSKSGIHSPLINRQKIIPELKEYAKKKGVPVYENVRTGRKTKGKPMYEVLKQIDKDITKTKKQQTMKNVKTGKAIGKGFGLYIALTSSFSLAKDIKLIHDNNSTNTELEYINLTQHSLEAVSGLGIIAANSMKPGTLSNSIGKGSYIILLATQGFEFYKYNEGYITLRDLNIGISGTATGWGGAVAGAKAGAFIGTCFNPGIGTIIGGFVGGVAGGIAGGLVGTYGANYYYSFEDERTLGKLIEHFLKRYNNVNNASGFV